MEDGIENVATVMNAAKYKKEKEEKEQQLENPVVPPPIIPRVAHPRALSKEAKTYELQNFEKKALIIFSQTNIDGFDNKFCHKCDEDVLIQTFAHFGFECGEVKKDMEKAEIMEELRVFCAKDYTDYGCVAVVVLTVGSNEGLIKAKDHDYSEFEITHHFNVETNPTLITKPKFLLIQAFQHGEDVDITVQDKENLMESYTLPKESDFLIVHSSYIENQATERSQGTWFIQNLCSRIQQLSNEKDLECILDELKLDMEGLQNHDFHLCVPVTMSTLIRQLYLKRFGDEPTVAVAISSVALAATSNSDMGNDVEMEAAEDIAPCACFLEHFNYMKACLSHYTEENPEDEKARELINEATGLGEAFNKEKEKEEMLAVIRSYLKEKTSDCEYAMCIHFYMEHYL